MEAIKGALEFYLVFAALFFILGIFIVALLLSVKLPLKIGNPYVRILTLATLLSVFFAPTLLGRSYAPAVFVLCAAQGWGLRSLRFTHGLYPFLATWILLIISLYLLWGKKWIKEKKFKDEIIPKGPG